MYEARVVIEVEGDSPEDAARSFVWAIRDLLDGYGLSGNPPTNLVVFVEDLDGRSNTAVELNAQEASR